uniref:Uncharacterized protein n=1 Tax=Arundo donax TaxID=35708 RepID=A0A0A9A583_ARUDO
MNILPLLAHRSGRLKAILPLAIQILLAAVHDFGHLMMTRFL